MKDIQENYYKTCRKLAGFTQESASELLGVEVRTLSNYENNGKTPDDIVDKMAEIYNAPLLAIWHLKENSPLGKYLPDVIQTQTHNDLGFQTVLAQKDTSKAEDYIVAILEDGKLSMDDLPTIDKYMISADAAIGKLISANAYIRKAKKELTNQDSKLIDQ